MTASAPLPSTASAALTACRGQWVPYQFFFHDNDDIHGIGAVCVSYKRALRGNFVDIISPKYTCIIHTTCYNLNVKFLFIYYVH